MIDVQKRMRSVCNVHLIILYPYLIPPALTSHPRKYHHLTSLKHQKWILTLRYANLSSGGDKLPHLIVQQPCMSYYLLLPTTT